MASDFKIGTTSGGMTALDALTTPLPDPQPVYRKYRVKKRLGNRKARGFGLPTVYWSFPMATVEEITQIKTFLSDSSIYIRSRNESDAFATFNVEMNILDPREDGEHMPGFQGYRRGLEIEFIVLSEA